MRVAPTFSLNCQFRVTAARASVSRMLDPPATLGSSMGCRPMRTFRSVSGTTQSM